MGGGGRVIKTTLSEFPAREFHLDALCRTGGNCLHRIGGTENKRKK